MVWYIPGLLAQRTVVALVTAVFFLYFFHMAITMACLLPSSDLHNSSTPRPTTLGAGHCNPLTPTTLLPSSLTRTNVISYNAVHSLRKVS